MPAEARCAAASGRSGSRGQEVPGVQRALWTVTWWVWPEIRKRPSQQGPTHNSTSPRLNRRTRSRSENASRVVGTTKRTTADSPASSASHR